MKTMEIGNELLDRALSVQSQAAPAALRGKVREAVAMADRGRGAGLSWGTGPTTFRRPALSLALRFALLGGLLVVALLGTAFYLGSLPPTVTPTPTSTVTPSPSPSPRVVTPTPAPMPTRTLLPVPWPLPTAGPDTTPTSYEDFAAHVTDSVAAFHVQAPAWYAYVTSLDGYYGSRPFVEQWLPTEEAWLATNRPAPCYATSFAAWASAVAAVDDATRRVGGPEPLSLNPDFPGIWAPRFRAVDTFKPSRDFSCAPITPAEFVFHVHARLETFGAAADGLYYWIKYLDYSGPGPDALRGHWLHDEIRWLDLNDPVSCVENSWQAWSAAVQEMAAASGSLQPFTGMSPDVEARFLAARTAIADFDPTAGNSCRL